MYFCFIFDFVCSFHYYFTFEKAKRAEIRKKLFKLIALFILFGALNYVFRPSDIDLFGEFYIALGLAFGIAFIDVAFLKRKEN